MRGTVNLSCPSYLPTLFGSSPKGASLLAILHGHTDPEPAMADPAGEPEPAMSDVIQPAVSITPSLTSAAEQPMELVV